VLRLSLRASTDSHQHFDSHVTQYDPAAQSMMQSMTDRNDRRRIDPATAAQQAYAAVAGMVDRHAYMMAFNDAFGFMMIVFCLCCHSSW